MLDDRQKNLLNSIISQYIKTAVPVGSKLVASDSDFDLSPATIRNEMAKLEEAGYIFQPHTSAGRAPTHKGYEFYVANFLKDSDLPAKKQEFLLKTIKSFKNYEPALVKQLAKGIAELATGTVFVGFSNSDFYYTGLSTLFSQPEFNERRFVHDVSRVIDHFDQVLEKLFSDVGDDIHILIGRNNPFGMECSSVITKYEINDQIGLVGILGPTRMDYQNNFSLIKCGRNLISNFR